MKCKKCGFDNMDGANFCINCGNKLENEPEVEETEEVVLDLGKDDQNAEPSPEAGKDETAAEKTLEEDGLSVEEPQEPLWYYVEKKESVGPFAQSKMVEFYQEGRLNDLSWVWTQGLDKWIHLDESALYPLMSENEKKEEPSSAIDELQSASENTAASAAASSASAASTASTVSSNGSTGDFGYGASNNNTAAATDWFYVDNGKSAGPYSEQVMASLIEQGVIGADAYVWKEGMYDWARLSDTELSRYLSNVYGSQAQSAPRPSAPSYSNNNYNNAPAANLYVQPHSVVLYILLCILTCGIWQLVWMYLLARDINTLASRQNRPLGPDPILSVILTILTCGIYQIYFFWKEENVLAQLSARNYQVQNQSVLTGILGFICAIAAAAIIQDQINCLVKYE